MIGRVVPNKQIDHGIYIIHQLQQQGYKYHLDIIGDTQDKIEYQKLKKITHELSIQDYIHFHGKMNHDHLITLMQDIQYLLLTSNKE
jgi:glycosyltransferase involved in cell wall biosynthesis